MNHSLYGLLTAYVLIALLLINLCFFSKWPLWLKSGMVVLVSGFYFVTYHSLFGLMGWAAATPLPERFLLIAQVIVEPDKESGNKGAIYLWADDLKTGYPSTIPRSYRLPYSATLHSKVAEAAKRKKLGITQVGVSKPVSHPGLLPGLADRLAPPVADELDFQDLPDPRLPEK